MYNETITNMLADLGVEPLFKSKSLDAMAVTDSKYLRDLKLNVVAMLNSNNINKRDAYLLALSVAINEKHVALISAFEQQAKKEGATDADIAETHACTSLMNANNVFYRFRHYLDGVEYYNNQPLGMRMNIMMNPVMGKELFELMSLVVSAVNGWQRGVTSHEHSVKQQGASEARIYDAIRLAAVIRSISTAL